MSLTTSSSGPRTPRHATPRSPSSQRLVASLLLLTAAACSDITGVEQPTSPARLGTDQASAEVSALAGTTYYVSPTGRDANAGTSPSAAWKTLRKVNSRNFAPGDRILFQGGASWSGSLTFDVNDKGSATAPIVVGRYGTGRPTISAGNATGIKLYNTSGFEIRGLNVVGAGRTVNTASGIDVYTDLAGGVKLPYLRIDSVDVGGFGKYGVSIGSWNGTTGFSDVRVTYTATHDNALSGFITYAQAMYVHQNVYVGRVQAWNNSGVSSLTTNSGSGIVIGGVSGGMVERSVAYNNGWLCTATEGPVGIWAYDSQNLVFQYNESHSNRTSGPVDGGGFDFDQNVRNSTLQYNYSHNNDGPGFLFAHSVGNTNHSGNVVRYNISENDGRRNSPGAITIYGRSLGAEIYNNTVYLTPASLGAPSGILVYNAGVPSLDVQRVHFRNNVVSTTGTLRALSVSNDQLTGAVDLRFEGNDYFAGAANPTMQWGGNSYSGLAAWRTATGQELLAGVALGKQVDPAFTSPGTGGTIGNADRLNTLSAYKLKVGSPLIDAGLNLSQQWAINVGPNDFWQASLPSGAGYDIGAHEWR